jgi:ketosteroid isomerase-like protein
MSAANVTLVQGLYAAFGRGDIAAIVAAMAPDVAWEVVGRKSDYPTVGLHKGAQGVQEFFRLVGELQQAHEFSPGEFSISGDKVFVTGHYAWTVKKTGRKVSADWIHIFTVKGGKVTAFREFTDTAQFAEANRA